MGNDTVGKELDVQSSICVCIPNTHIKKRYGGGTCNPSAEKGEKGGR